MKFVNPYKLKVGDRIVCKDANEEADLTMMLAKYDVETDFKTDGTNKYELEVIATVY